MKKDIVNPYKDAEKYNCSPCSKPISADDFLRLCEEGKGYISKKISSKTYDRQTDFSLFVLRQYLKIADLKGIIPDERFFDHLRELIINTLKSKNNKPYSLKTVQDVVSDIRRLINEYFLVKGIINRPILQPSIWRKYQRFLGLSECTRRLILLIEEKGKKVTIEKLEKGDGRRGMRPVVFEEAENLAESTRTKIIEAVFQLLSALNKTAIEEITSQDILDFRQWSKDKGQINKCDKLLGSGLTSIGNGLNAKILIKNPFEYVYFKTVKAKYRDDYLLAEDVRKLQDFDGLQGFIKTATARELIDRLITLLFLDTALRSSELSNLTVDMIREISSHSTFQILLPGYLQKKGRRGGDKKDAVLFLHKFSTVWLMRYYLNVIRPQIKSKSNCLFVSPKTLERYKETGIRKAVKRACEKFNIRTLKKKIVFPHILRHTALTLQSDDLTSYELQDRARHSDSRTTERYRHEQTRLRKAKELIEKDRNRSAVFLLDKDLIVKLFKELKPFIGNDVYSKVLSSYNELTEQGEGGKNCENASGYSVNDDKAFSMTEKEVLEKLKAYDLEKRSLRKYCLLEHKARMVILKGGKRFFYDKAFITSLIEDFWPKEAVLEKYGFGKTKFFEDLKLCRKLQVGDKILVYRGDAAKMLLSAKDNSTRNRIKEQEVEYGLRSRGADNMHERCGQYARFGSYNY